MSTRVTVIVSKIHYSKGFEQLFDSLSKQVDLSVVLINEQKSALFDWLQANGIDSEEIIYKGKRDAIKVVRKLISFIKKRQPEVVHTHLIDAGMYGGIASWLTGVPMRVYTRHHGDQHFYKNKRGRLYDRLIHAFHHKLIVLSESHKLHIQNREKINPERLVMIPNFFDDSIFDVSEDRIETTRKVYGMNQDDIKIGINARWTAWKGVHIALQGLLKLLVEYPNIKIYMFNCTGDYEAEILPLVEQFPSGTVTVTKFEKDIMSVFYNLDLFLHAPMRSTSESFGLVYLEAMGCGIPCVFTLSGIAGEIVIPNKNAVVAEHGSIESLCEATRSLLSDPVFRASIGHEAKQTRGVYSLDRHLNALIKLYEGKSA